MENNWRIADLIKKHLQEEITDGERKELEAWLSESDANRQFFQRFDNPAYIAHELQLMSRADTEAALASFLQSIGAGQKSIARMSWKRWTIAASLLLVISTAAWLVIRTNAPHPIIAQQPPVVAKDIPAGTDKAVLTLADGRKIALDSAANGQLARQGNAKVIKAGGQLKYSNEAGAAPGPAVAYNSISTPRGGQYQLVLQDGTKVWLNAATVFRFPAAFTGSERRVELSGEGYFEVARSGKPFKVIVPAGPSKPAEEIDVLGTHFNVMAYNEEPQSKTTLLEGKVSITSGLRTTNNEQRTTILSPGQQAQQASSGAVNVDGHADIEQAVAWKNGMQSFHDADIKTIMRQVSRWYDIDVAYKGDIPEIGLTGKIPRSISLKRLLEALELNSSLHFQLADGKVTVTP